MNLQVQQKRPWKLQVDPSRPPFLAHISLVKQRPSLLPEKQRDSWYWNATSGIAAADELELVTLEESVNIV